MAKAVIIGAGYAGRNLAHAVSERMDVVVLDKESVLCVKENFVPWLLGKKADEEIVCKPRVYFASIERIDFINAKVEKIFPLKKEVSLQEKGRLAYDYLFIASGSVSRRKENTPGDGKRGVMYASGIKPEELLSMLPVSRFVVVEAHTLFGLVSAVFLSRKQKNIEVKLVIPSRALKEMN